jgi:hypothetical protein
MLIKKLMSPLPMLHPPVAKIHTKPEIANDFAAHVTDFAAHVTDFAAHVASMVFAHDYRQLELEVRIGCKTAGGAFVSDIGQAGYAKLRKHLGEPHATSHTVETSGPGDARQIEDRIHGVTTRIHKRRLRNADIVCGGSCVLRVATSLEITEQLTGNLTTNDSKPTGFVREKRRVSYDKGAWRIDLTHVESAGTTTFEAEVELVDKAELFRKTCDVVVAEGLALAEDLARTALKES